MITFLINIVSILRLSGAFMLKLHCFLFLSFVSSAALSEVSFQDKVRRVNLLERLTKGNFQISLEGYKRELIYEQKGLPLEERVEIESNLLAETIKNQIIKAYESAFAVNQDHEEAIEEIRNAVARDLKLASPEIQEDLHQISVETIDNLANGVNHSSAKNENIKKIMADEVEKRVTYLNNESDLELSDSIDNDLKKFNKLFKSKVDPTILSYARKSDLLSTLVSHEEHSSWIYTSTVSMSSADSIQMDANISLQVNIEFLGASVAAGPKINFSRKYKTNVFVNAEGMNPILSAEGNFDLRFRDRSGKTTDKGRKRKMDFYCQAELDFESQYSGGGGFSYSGIGASASVAKGYTNSVILKSRRLIVPEFVENRQVTYKFLVDLCNKDFLNTKIDDTMTVSDSLNVMMKGMVTNLIFSHPKTNCAIDSHCYNWFNQEVVSLIRSKNYPRCVEDKQEQFMGCELRGLKGQNCSIYDNQGKRISNGILEYTCDKGLKCIQVKESRWPGFAKGVCTPINPKTYVHP